MVVGDIGEWWVFCIVWLVSNMGFFLFVGIWVFDVFYWFFKWGRWGDVLVRDCCRWFWDGRSGWGSESVKCMLLIWDFFFVLCKIGCCLMGMVFVLC